MLKKENSDMRDRLAERQHFEEQRFPFNHLDITVRPSRYDRLMRYELLELDLRVMGNDKMPTIAKVNTISLSAFDLLRENEADFIKGIGELMAKELMAYGQKVQK
jgi:hypothetical protein